MNDVSRIIIGIATKHFGAYRVRGDEVIAEYCPFCHGGSNGDRETFAVNMKSGAYNCRRGSCNASGSLKSLLEHLSENIDIDVRVPTTLGRKKKVIEKPDEAMLKPLTEEIVTYFASRMISEDTLRDFKIASNEEGNIVFPFYRNNVLTFVKFRKPAQHKKGDGPKEWQMKNTEPILFGMDNVSFNKPLIITEGECDALAVYEAGFHNVVSVPCGCDNMNWVDTCKSWLENFNRFILFGDSDEPGLRMISNLSEELGRDRCQVPPEYPPLIVGGKPGNRICKDPNEILYCYGPEGIKAVLDQCEEVPVEGILDLADVPDVDPTKIPRILTMIPELDYKIGGFAEGSVTILSGKRGEGKSTFSGPVCLSAIEQGNNVCMYSGELPAYKVKEWIYLQATEQKYISVSRDPRSGKLFPTITPEIRDRISDWLRGHFFLYDNQIVTDGSEPEAVLKVFQTCARRYGCKLFVVDNLMSILRAPDEENLAQARFTAAVKAFAMKYRVAVLMVCHPRKEKAGTKFDNDSVSGSSAITNLADLVLNIERPNVRVTKNRDFGEFGVVCCTYNPANRRIFQTSAGDRIVYSWNHEGITPPEHSVDEYGDFKLQIGEPDCGSVHFAA